ncbi:GDP-mannose 4,6-dehydratase [Chenggangzhangella methanolivorans]|uniref:GDP-mannose 4,6-dehydratase n=1 Tax=Chenggangzhangella methanolivorans TaxID=1437009 RepID=A0A9E6R8D0_9HYPH|nr:GDP-mannose 4,6-dehydratase [Chenggangzhangella methanolivorans]QZN98512.1 GDP-mannose 4,6-dehydratase [Chenggangzhangella methanolivorans]
MASALITGGAGFIGSRLAAALVARGDRVTVLDNLHPQVHGPDPKLPDWPESVVFRKGDVCDPAAVSEAVRAADPDVVYHLAAETGTGQSYDEPTRYCAVNVLGCTHLVEALRALAPRARRVVLASSRSVYGEGAARGADGRVVSAPPRSTGDLAAGRFGLADEAGQALEPCPTDEALPARPASVYASTKLMQEYVLKQCAEGSDLGVFVLRFQNVYGPGQSLYNAYTGVLSVFSKMILDGKILEIYEDGDIARDFVFVDDVVAALAAAGAAATVPDGPINIGTGSEAKIVDVARILLKAMGRSPDDLRISGKFRPGDVRYAVGDVAKARETLGWEPRVTLAEGLSALAEWAKVERAAGRI